MFIKLQKSPTSSRVQVYLMESYRDQDGKPRHRIVTRYGELGELEAAEPGVLDRLKKEAAQAAPSVDRRLVEIDCSRPRAAGEVGTCYGNLILDGLWGGLGLPELFARLRREAGAATDVGAVARLLVTGRALDPASKLATWGKRGQWFDPADLSLDDVYRGLDHLNAWSQQIQEHLSRRVATSVGRDETLMFYDVTNYWFETDLEDGFRMLGACKEHRPDPIVQMGLLIDRAGIPVAYQLFPGNTHDATTLAPVLSRLRAGFAPGRIVVVADKGLNAKTNLDALANNGDGWIVAQKVRGRVAPDITGHLRDDTDWSWAPDGSFATKHYLRTRRLASGPTPERVVLMWSRANAVRDQAKREKLRGKVQALVDHPGDYESSNRYGRKRYIGETLVTVDGQIAGKHLSFNQAQWDADAALDGYYAIITSETRLTDQEVIDAYRGLARIEESFKVIKSDLQGRPVHVWTPAHINAHFLTCFIALTMIRLIQAATGWHLTAHQVKHALASARMTPLERGVMIVDETTGPYKTIEQAWAVSLPQRYAPIEALRAYRRAIKANTKRTLQNANTNTEP